VVATGGNGDDVREIGRQVDLAGAMVAPADDGSVGEQAGLCQVPRPCR